MTPSTNVADCNDQINKNTYLNSVPTCEQLKIIKKHKALEIACISKSTMHLKIIEGLFPPSISLGDRAVAFVKHEVLAVVAAQIQGQSKDEIRLLVKELVAQRQTLGGL
ncbi:MAG: AlpA family phage regulatory protein [Colwellia sp.]|nr:AlpA family phage regulatory protein [Colwellia sp.]MCW8864061.1 AlpA family phage regulatory protein [Colwellia sp.]MCW9081402.1 AlpA family phage regulatory protein [Colwellia sp.]